MSPCGIVHRCSPVFMSIATMRPSGPLKRSGNAGERIVRRLGRRRAASLTRGDPVGQRLAGHLVVSRSVAGARIVGEQPLDRGDEDHARRRVGRRWSGDVRATAAARADVRGALALLVAAMRRRREQRRQQDRASARARARASGSPACSRSGALRCGPAGRTAPAWSGAAASRAAFRPAPATAAPAVRPSARSARRSGG